METHSLRLFLFFACCGGLLIALFCEFLSTLEVGRLLAEAFPGLLIDSFGETNSSAAATLVTSLRVLDLTPRC